MDVDILKAFSKSGYGISACERAADEHHNDLREGTKNRTISATKKNGKAANYQGFLPLSITFCQL
jgi:hypothetical protein